MLSIPAPLRAAIAALALLAALAPVAATASEGRSPRAVIDVRARILPFLKMTVLAARTAFELTAEDTRRREAIVPNATEVEVFCNLHGYDLRFELLDPEVVAVEVEGLPLAVRVGAGGLTVHVPTTAPQERRARRTLSYRVLYESGVKPGPRPMPLALSLAHP